MSWPRFDDFVTFSRAHIETGDIYPIYSVLRAYHAAQETPEEVALWRSLIFVTWYHLGSAEKVWTAHPQPREIYGQIRLPTGLPRRGFRGNDLGVLHLNGLVVGLKRRWGSLTAWAWEMVAPGGPEAWRRLYGTYQAFPHAGPWAAYKICEVFKHVHGYNLDAPDLGVGSGVETTGPIRGMVLVTGESYERCRDDKALQRQLYEAAQLRGVPLTTTDQLESTLCDFCSLVFGRYYVGRRIDAMMDQLRASVTTAYWTARAQLFAPRLLGEVGGWTGVRKPMERDYKEKGIIHT